MVTTNNGTLTITPAALEHHSRQSNKRLRPAIPALTGELVGVVNNDSITASYTTVATTGSPVGQYAITSACVE